MRNFPEVCKRVKTLLIVGPRALDSGKTGPNLNGHTL